VNQLLVLILDETIIKVDDDEVLEVVVVSLNLLVNQFCQHPRVQRVEQRQRLAFAHEKQAVHQLELIELVYFYLINYI
jgi:hypothetical protein